LKTEVKTAVETDATLLLAQAAVSLQAETDVAADTADASQSVEETETGVAASVAAESEGESAATLTAQQAAFLRAAAKAEKKADKFDEKAEKFEAKAAAGLDTAVETGSENPASRLDEVRAAIIEKWEGKKEELTAKFEAKFEARDAAFAEKAALHLKANAATNLPSVQQAATQVGKALSVAEFFTRDVASVSARAEVANQQAFGGEGVKHAGSYDFAAQLSAARAVKGGPAGLPAAVEQVTLHIHRQAKAGIDQMTLQLRPAELGRIDVKLDFAPDGGSVKGTVIVETQATLDLLSKDVRSLERALQEAGLRADSGCLEFQLRDQGEGRQAEQDAPKSGGDVKAAPAEEIALDEPAMIETYYVTPGRVNIRV
jgi:flagellar hook-length control protein FliK